MTCRELVSEKPGDPTCAGCIPTFDGYELVTQIHVVQAKGLQRNNGDKGTTYTWCLSRIDVGQNPNHNFIWGVFSYPFHPFPSVPFPSFPFFSSLSSVELAPHIQRRDCYQCLQPPDTCPGLLILVHQYCVCGRTPVANALLMYLEPRERVWWLQMSSSRSYRPHIASSEMISSRRMEEAPDAN